MGTLFGFVVVGFLALIAFALLKKRAGGGSSSESTYSPGRTRQSYSGSGDSGASAPAYQPPRAAPQPEESPGAEKAQELLAKLLGIQQMVVEDPLRDEDVVVKVSTVLDLLVDLLQPVNEKFPGSELCYVVNEMVEKYLLDLLRPYISLDAGNRADKKDDMVAALDEMIGQLENAQQAVQAGDASAFTIQAKFVKQRLDGGNE